MRRQAAADRDVLLSVQQRPTILSEGCVWAPMTRAPSAGGAACGAWVERGLALRQPWTRRDSRAVFSSRSAQADAGIDAGCLACAMAAPVPRAAVFDLEASQRIELPTDNGLLRPALTQSLEFHKVRIGRALAKPRALTRVAQISLRLQLRARRGKASVERDILRDVSGACFPGMLMAIMGATGSGKTSLMNVLARRLVLSKGLHVSGAVLLNGAPRPRQWKSNYVEQHDLLFAELSVRETLQTLRLCHCT